MGASRRYAGNRSREWSNSLQPRDLGEVGMGFATAGKISFLQHRLMERNRGRNAFDIELGKRATTTGQRFITIAAPYDELRHHGVVERRDNRTRLNVRFDAHARTARNIETRNGAWAPDGSHFPGPPH